MMFSRVEIIFRRAKGKFSSLEVSVVSNAFENVLLHFFSKIKTKREIFEYSQSGNVN